MWSREISPKQRMAWVALAALGIQSRFAGGTDWLTALAAGLIWAAVFMLLDRTPTKEKPLGVVQSVWNVVLLSQVMTWSTGCWPQGEATAFLPITLLVLAAASVRRNTPAAVSVQFWAGALLIIPVMLSAVKELEPAWLIPEPQTGGIRIAAGYGVLLSALALPRKEKGSAGWLPGIALFGALIAGLTDGVLSPQLTAGKDEAFYAMSRSLNLFGSVRRFESLVSAAVTLGWFALMSMLLMPMGEKWSIVGAATATCLYVANIRLSPEIVLIISLFAAIAGKIPLKKLKNNA